MRARPRDLLILASLCSIAACGPMAAQEPEGEAGARAGAATATCQVVYSVVSQWTGGFQANVKIVNLGSASIAGWSLGWTFKDGQRVQQLWNAAWSQSGATVTASNPSGSWNGTIGANGGSVSFGFTGSYSGSNGVPTDFLVNGASCNGGTGPDTQPPTTPENLTSPTQTASTVALSWSASRDDVAVTGYDVYRGTTLAGSTATTSFTDSGLQPDTAYAYAVRARDAAGNASASSAALSVRTATSSTGGAVTLVPDPSWTCGMASGIPAPTLGQLVFRATLPLGSVRDVGTTPYGRRRFADVKGGTVAGSRIQATVLPGGLDFELTLSNGAVELEQVLMLRASDGALIYLRSCGVAPAGAAEVRVVPDFEVASSSALAWLNTGKFVGTRTIDAAAGTMQLDVYDVSSVAAGTTRVQLADPPGVPNQPWDCATATGTRGSSVFTETVTLGASLSVGASKRGTRNVIPITGGRVSGRLNGTVVSAGADYQLIGGSGARLDARYVLAANDGEYVLVRNCGPMGALVPQFEARSDGPYAFLDSNTYLSSDPGSASGGVSITFYERR